VPAGTARVRTNVNSHHNMAELLRAAEILRCIKAEFKDFPGAPVIPGSVPAPTPMVFDPEPSPPPAAPVHSAPPTEQPPKPQHKSTPEEVRVDDKIKHKQEVVTDEQVDQTVSVGGYGGWCSVM